MPVTLLSPKAMLRNEGIRTYLNDELYLLMPDGEIVKIIETATNYDFATTVVPSLLPLPSRLSPTRFR